MRFDQCILQVMAYECVNNDKSYKETPSYTKVDGAMNARNDQKSSQRARLYKTGNPRKRCNSQKQISKMAMTGHIAKRTQLLNCKNTDVVFKSYQWTKRSAKFE